MMCVYRACSCGVLQLPGWYAIIATRVEDRKESPILILGIETSCDETAAAIVEDGLYIRSNVIASQIELHRQYGGVFPEMASREHIRTIIPVIQDSLAQAEVDWEDLDGIAVTRGPGLAGSDLASFCAIPARYFDGFHPFSGGRERSCKSGGSHLPESGTSLVERRGGERRKRHRHCQRGAPDDV